MTKIRLNYIHEFSDRHGKVRRYVRLPGGKRIPLRGAPGTDEFMDGYRAALASDAPRVEIGASRTKPGTVNAAVVGYFGSTAFLSLAPSTRTTYRGIIDAFRAEHGDKRIAMLERRHITRIVAEKSATPSAANNLLKMLRMLTQFAIAEEMRRDDPTLGIKGIKLNNDGFYTWSEGDIAAYEATHPLGTRARLALLLYTAQRRSDVIRMGRQHIRDGVLTIRQRKTGTVVEIPVHSELQAALAAVELELLTFLTTKHGSPFTPAGFTNWFRECCIGAGLPKGCSPHGLRKAASRRLAEYGCTAHEIMSITGHKTLKEVTRYTAAVDREAPRRHGDGEDRKQNNDWQT